MPDAALLFDIAMIQQPGERHFKPVCHLIGAGNNGKVWRHQPNHRNDAKATSGKIGGGCADHVYLFGRNGEFLLRLAQGGSDGILVLRFQLAARKGDLRGMAAQPVGTLGQDHARLIARGDGDEDGRLTIAAGRRAEAGLILMHGVHGERAGQPGGKAHADGSTVKKLPPLQMPG